MNNKDIRKQITKEISEGAGKSALYNQYKDQLNDENLRAMLASRPSFKLWKRYKNVHLILSLIWGFYILVELIGIFELMIAFNIIHLISLLLSIFVTINIWKFDGRFFLPGIVWFSVTIIRTFSELNSVFNSDVDYKAAFIFVMIYGSILILGIYLMVYIRKHVFYYMTWFKPILNEEGEIQYE
ncbi:hypothetical protein [Winogradskyella thalassocola]|uniref:Uncharacterized protein n=1 Tax=Winogradskyella thalassocola TaxID=262004 RepID=A0A1G8IW55_9FLAO|nr:hypothetical protein [Winogradskyella thalassocola]SDI23032.1 hypothetical protein SAMN04489796_10895 [Winogradskyella thalassocola]